MNEVLNDLEDGLVTSSELVKTYVIDGVNALSWLQRSNNRDDAKGLRRYEYKFRRTPRSPEQTALAYSFDEVVAFANERGAAVQHISEVRVTEIEHLENKKAQAQLELDTILREVCRLKDEAKLYDQSVIFGEIGAYAYRLSDNNGVRRRLATRDEILADAKTYRPQCGVYFLIKNEEIVYVGQSINVHSRITQHLASKDFDSVSFIACEKEHLDLLESMYILAFSPKLNGNPPFGLQAVLSKLEGEQK